MKYVQAKPSRLHCSNCDETYSLPQNGNIKLYKELKCPLDDFELILWTTGVRGKVSHYNSKCSSFHVVVYIVMVGSVLYDHVFNLLEFSYFTFLLDSVYCHEKICWE